MKIGRAFPKPSRVNWRLKKARAAYINRRQQTIEDDAYRPENTFGIELELEQSTTLNPRYIYTEASQKYIEIGIPYLMYEESTAENLLYIYNEALTETVTEEY